MAGEQSQLLGEFTGAKAPYSYRTQQRLGFDPAEHLGDDLHVLGLDAEAFGKHAWNLDTSRPFFRYQRMIVYEYPRFVKRGGSWESEVGYIQLKTYVYTVDTPPAQVLRDRIDEDVHRVATAFNSSFNQADYKKAGDTYEQYLSKVGYQNFHAVRVVDPEVEYQGVESMWDITESDERKKREILGGSGSVEAANELEEVGAVHAHNIGVPQYAIEMYDPKANLQGYSHGFAEPWRFWKAEAENDAPQHEVWDVGAVPSYPTARGIRDGRFELRAPGGTKARERAENVAHEVEKNVYLNGIYIGELNPSRASVWLRAEYPDHSGPDGRRDRDYIVEHSPAFYQSIQRGANVYKIRETHERIDLVTSSEKPDDFDPTDPDDVDPEAVGGEAAAESYYLDLDPEATRFEVREDVDQGALGKYAAPTAFHVQALTMPGDIVHEERSDRASDRQRHPMEASSNRQRRQWGGR